jgi:peptidoglycan/xylan/chitin deacetylase (PgdA/CDA1 family)
MIADRKKVSVAASLALALVCFAPAAFAQPSADQSVPSPAKTQASIPAAQPQSPAQAQPEIPPPEPSQSGGPMVTILCYHHVDLPAAGNYSVSSEQLSAQIDALLAASFSFIDSATLEAFYVKGSPIPEKAALITFDDGNYDVYKHAYPLLKKRGLPFTFFVYPHLVNIGHSKNCVDWRDLKEMAANGVTIGSHTMTHPFLTNPPATVANKEAYDEWLKDELVRSRSLIEVKLGLPVTELAVPFGAFDGYVEEKIKAAGYTLAFNVDGTTADIRADRWNVDRIIVKSNMSMPEFLELATARPLYFRDVSPAELSRLSTEKEEVAFTLDDARAYDESTVKFHVTSFPGLDRQYVREGDRFSQLVNFTRPAFYEVFVQVKDREGRPCRGSWLFIYEKDLPAYLKSAPDPKLNEAEKPKAKQAS